MLIESDAKFLAREMVKEVSLVIKPEGEKRITVIYDKKTRKVIVELKLM